MAGADGISVKLILNALHQYTDVKILSNPSLVVVDNRPATLEVGDQVPISTGSATVLSANNAVVNTVDYKNTGIILHVQAAGEFQWHGPSRHRAGNQHRALNNSQQRAALPPTI